MVDLLMDKEIFVQNVKSFCAIRGVKPSVACRESGVGIKFFQNIERGSIPSVEKVQLLAAYLGVSTSDLLGEKTSFLHEGPDQPFLVMRFNALSKDDQEEILTLVEMKYHKALREITEATEEPDK